jgi:hypothetical protein
VVAEEGEDSQMGWDFGFSNFFSGIEVESIAGSAAAKAVELRRKKNSHHALPGSPGQLRGHGDTGGWPPVPGRKYPEGQINAGDGKVRIFSRLIRIRMTVH